MGVVADVEIHLLVASAAAEMDALLCNSTSEMRRGLTEASRPMPGDSTNGWRLDVEELRTEGSDVRLLPVVGGAGLGLIGGTALGFELESTASTCPMLPDCLAGATAAPLVRLVGASHLLSLSWVVFGLLSLCLLDLRDFLMCEGETAPNLLAWLPSETVAVPVDEVEMRSSPVTMKCALG